MKQKLKNRDMEAFAVFDIGGQGMRNRGVLGIFQTEQKALEAVHGDTWYPIVKIEIDRLYHSGLDEARHDQMKKTNVKPLTNRDMDLILRIKTLIWKQTKCYSIMGGYNYEYTANNGDKIIISTCNIVSTKYLINGNPKSVFGKEENFIINKFW